MRWPCQINATVKCDPNGLPPARIHVNSCYSFVISNRNELLMTNLTISLDEDIVRGARIRAIQEGTSVSAKVRDFLRQYVEGTSTQEAQLRKAATQRLMDNIAKATQASEASESVQTEGGTLRGELYSDDFRQKAGAELKANAA